MANINRVRVAISGGVIGNAYMNWYFTTNASANLTAISTMVNALKAYIPQATSYTIPNTGDLVDDNDGKLVGAWGTGSPVTVQGTSVDTYAGQAGALVLWNTSTVVDSHRPKGRSIWVPLTRAVYDTNGKLASAFAGVLTTAANAFLASSTGFVVWHRPVYTGNPPNRVLSRPGSSVPVTSATVNLTLATLRSRNH
jgi:hypothetical protein